MPAETTGLRLDVAADSDANADAAPAADPALHAGHHPEVATADAGVAAAADQRARGDAEHPGQRPAWRQWLSRQRPAWPRWLRADRHLEDDAAEADQRARGGAARPGHRPAWRQRWSRPRQA